MRSDIAGIIGFIPTRRWPRDTGAGDFVEIVLRRESDLWAHPDRGLFDPAARRAVRGFFANGGDTAHLFGVCIRGEDELRSPAGAMEVFEPLLHRLRCEDDIAILLVPGAAYMRCNMGRDGVVRADAEALYDLLLRHCREMNNRFLVMDAPRGLHGEPLVRWVRNVRSQEPETRAYGAIYYPWLHRGDDLFPPSGVIAGTYARIELENPRQGVAWPPANRPILDVTHTEVDLDWTEAGALVDEAINPIIVQPGRGVVAFGARTLSTDSRWMYVNSRRVVNMISEQLRRDSQWAVFELNNPHLWNVLERDVRHRLAEFWGRGMLAGDVAGADYEVKCNEETNSPVLRDAGQVNVQVRMRPVGCTEQIVIDLRVGGEGF